jgi:hypothetical protein
VKVRSQNHKIPTQYHSAASKAEYYTKAGKYKIGERGTEVRVGVFEDKKNIKTLITKRKDTKILDFPTIS